MWLAQRHRFGIHDEAVNLMVTCRLVNISIESAVPWVMWMVLAMTGAILVVTFAPELALWLPRVLGYLG